MCRTQLEDLTKHGVFGDKYDGWKFYECPNCGSAVYIDPFLRVREGKLR
jgi:hypothetical protein